MTNDREYGKKQVKYLNAIVLNLYKNNPDQLRAWASASHVEHDPNHQSATPTPALTATATAK